MPHLLLSYILQVNTGHVCIMQLLQSPILSLRHRNVRVKKLRRSQRWRPCLWASIQREGEQCNVTLLCIFHWFGEGEKSNVVYKNLMCDICLKRRSQVWSSLSVFNLFPLKLHSHLSVVFFRNFYKRFCTVFLKYFWDLGVFFVSQYREKSPVSYVMSFSFFVLCINF